MKKSNIVYVKQTMLYIDFLARFDNMYKYISIALVRLGVMIIDYVCLCLCI